MICGITRLEDALFAAGAGAHYLGFIFARSPRRVTPEQAGAITRACPPSVLKVGVFVNEPEESIRRTVAAAGLDMIQLHGDEPPELCSRFELPVIKVLQTRGEEILEIIPRYETDFILLEAYVPGLRGGTGETADWSLAARVGKEFPARKFFLAGGLNPGNIASAVRAVGPFAVDVGSGVEKEPGVKDHARIASLMEVLKI